MDMLQSFRFSQAWSVPTHRCRQTLDLVVYREKNAHLRSLSVYHSLSCDHLLVTCSLSMSKPEPRPVLRTVRSFPAIDMQQFRQDTASLEAVQLHIKADQSNTEMRRLLDTHAPTTQCQVNRRHRSSWYSSIAP